MYLGGALLDADSADVYLCRDLIPSTPSAPGDPLAAPEAPEDAAAEESGSPSASEAALSFEELMNANSSKTQNYLILNKTISIS